VTENVHHNHPTRDIKPHGAGCPACDAYHERHGVPAPTEAPGS
jgi:hypothetical protein